MLKVDVGSLSPTAFAATLRSSTESKRMAYLSSGTPASGAKLFEVLKISLRELGWTENANVLFDLQPAKSDKALAKTLTLNMLSLRPDIFVASDDIDARIAADLSTSAHIVFVHGFDPVGVGVVRSLADPKAMQPDFPC